MIVATDIIMLNLTDPSLPQKVLEILGIGEIDEIYGGYFRPFSATDSV